MKPWLILLIVFAILIAIYVISGLIVRALLKNQLTLSTLWPLWKETVMTD